MGSPSKSLATLRPDIAGSFQEFDLEMDRQGFIGHQVMPVFEAGEQSGTFGRINIEDLLRNEETRRAPRGKYRRGDWDFTDDSYATKEQGWEEPVDDNEERMYRNYFDLELIAGLRARDAVLRAAERRIADAVFNATTWTPTSVANEWDDLANATPIADVEAAVQRVYDATGMWPNAIIFNRKVFRNVRRTTDIIDRLKYSGHDDPKKITSAMLAELFDLQHVLIAGSSQNTAKQGQAASLSPIWSSEYAMICRVAESNDIAEPCLGRTFHWAEDGSDVLGTVESYREESSRGDIVRVRHQVGEKLLYTEMGELLDNITT